MSYTFRYRIKGDKRDWANLPIVKILECHKRDARDIATSTMVINPDIQEVIILKKNSKATNRMVVKNPNRK